MHVILASFVFALQAKQVLHHIVKFAKMAGLFDFSALFSVNARL